MTDTPDEFSRRLRRKTDRMVNRLVELVRLESPSGDRVALKALADNISTRLDSLGLEVERTVSDRDAGQILARVNPTREPGTTHVLVLGHLDTVWPIGTLDRLGAHIGQGRVTGPGCFDMKAGLVIIEFAFEAIRELRRTTRRPVLVVLTTDEEVGSPAGRPCVERMSQGAACALVLEPSLPGGAVKTARKGVGRFDLFIQGRAAHAGLNPEQGVSAVIELARKLLEIDQLANSSLGTTLTVGTIRGGTATNVVPAESAASIDARVWSLAEASRVESALRSLRPDDPRASLRIEGRWNRPPMERTPASEALFEEARGIAGRLGQTLIEGSAGGGSDGNFTAALGIPTLDGLGAEGDGAHADHEYIIIDSLPDRAALLASLLCEL